MGEGEKESKITVSIYGKEKKMRSFIEYKTDENGFGTGKMRGISKEGKYSAISTSSGGFAIADNYDYVGYLNNSYTKDIFSVSLNNEFYLIGISDTVDENIITKVFTEPIYFYTSYAVIVNSNGGFAIYDYNGEAIRNNINKINIVNNSIILRNNFNKVFVYNSLNDFKAFTDYDKTYDYEIIDNSVSIMANGQTIETIDLLGE